MCTVELSYPIVDPNKMCAGSDVSSIPLTIPPRNTESSLLTTSSASLPSGLTT